TLIVHDLQPGPRAESLARIDRDVTVFSEHLDPESQRVRNRHVLAVTPELRVFAFRRVIVQSDEIANIVESVGDAAVVLLYHIRPEPPVGKELDKPHDRVLDQMNVCG